MSLEPERPAHPEEADRHTKEYEKKWVGTWWAPIMVALGIAVWCFAIYFMIGDRSREWQYGTVPYVPGESIYSSERVPSSPGGPKQIELPEPESEGGGDAR